MGFRIAPPDAYPTPLLNVQTGSAGMRKVELAQGILLVQPAIGLHRGHRFRANLHDGDVVQNALLPLGMGLQRLDD